VLANGTAYLKGDAGAWSLELGITGGPGLTDASHWVAVSSKCTSGTEDECRLFQRLTRGLTVQTAMAPAAMTGPFTLVPPTTVLGQHVVGIKGTTAKTLRSPVDSEVLYVRATGTPLPVEAVEPALANLAGAGTFKYQWGEVPRARPPSSSIAFNPDWLAN